MKLNRKIKTVLTLVLFLAVSTVFAQVPTEGDESEEPLGSPLDPTPISDYLLPMLVIGVATAFILLKKKTTQHLS